MYKKKISFFNILFGLYLDLKTLIRNRLFFYFYTKKILTRTSCLGNECIKYLKIKNTINLQKYRIDGFLKKESYPFQFEVINFLNNFDCLNFIGQLQINPLSIRKYEYILFDSFSELVDSKFKLPNKKVFFTVKGDVNLNKLEKKGGDYLKQLDLSEISEIYTEVFDQLWNKYHCNIYFILCPTKFDTRNYYKERSYKIAKSIKEISEKKRYLKFIQLEEKEIIQSSTDKFPYHFDEKTIEKYSALLASEINSKNH